MYDILHMDIYVEFATYMVQKEAQYTPNVPNDLMDYNLIWHFIKHSLVEGHTPNSRLWWSVQVQSSVYPHKHINLQ